MALTKYYISKNISSNYIYTNPFVENVDLHNCTHHWRENYLIDFHQIK